MKRKFTSIIEKQGKWYIGHIEEVPGVNTQGRTLKEALQLVIKSNRELYQRSHPDVPVVKESIEINI